MLPEGELIKNSHNPCLVCRVVLFNSGKDPVFYLPVIKVELLVPTYLHGDLLPLLLYIEGPHNLSERALINYLRNQVSEANLLSYSCFIVAIRISTLTEALSAIATNGIDCIIERELRLLERGELILVPIKGFGWGKTELNWRVRAGHGGGC